MPLFRQVWQFESPPGGYWNEILYLTATDLDAASKIPTELVNARLALLHDHNILRKIRVSNNNNTRLSLPVTFNRRGEYKPNPDAPNRPLEVGTALVINLVSPAAGSNRKIWLRGIANTMVERNATTGLDFLGDVTADNVKTWLLHISADGYQIRTRNRIGQGGVVRCNITRVDGSIDAGTSIIYTDIASGAAKDEQVSIQACNPKNVPGLKGPFKVLAVDNVAKTITVKYRTPFDRNILAPGGGYLYALTYKADAGISNLRSGFAYLGNRRAKNVDTGSRGARRVGKGLRSA